MAREDEVVQQETRKRQIGYAAPVDHASLFTLYIGKLDSALKGAAVSPNEYRIITKGQKDLKVILFGERRENPEPTLAILQNALSGAGSVPRLDFKPLYFTIDTESNELLNQLEGELNDVVALKEEALRASKIAVKNQEVAYNSISERDLMARQREEALREERDMVRTQFESVVKSNTSLKDRARKAEEERNNAEERYTKLLSEQAKRARTLQELIVSGIRDYESRMSELDGYMKELLENFPDGNFNPLSVMSGKTEDDFVSSALKGHGVKHDEVSIEPMPAWRETSEHNSGFPEYQIACDTSAFIEAGMKGTGLEKDKLPPGMREVLEKSEAVKIKFEDAERNYKRKSDASKAAADARETYRKLKGLADKVSAMPAAEIPVAAVFDGTGFRVYVPYAGGKVSAWVSDGITTALGDGFEIKEEGSVRVISKTIEPMTAENYLSKLRSAKGMPVPKPLSGSLKLTILES